ncbi:MAG: hypothetical protein WAL72_32015 [Streptosporangiaceae bacterium]
MKNAMKKLTGSSVGVDVGVGVNVGVGPPLPETSGAIVCALAPELLLATVSAMPTPVSGMMAIATLAIPLRIFMVPPLVSCQIWRIARRYHGKRSP